MIDSFEAQKVISRHRGDAIVVATMTTQWEWPQVSTNPDLDFLFSASMGKASSIGLGLALALPDKKVIILDGDGSLLMNLGSLVTIANMAPPNLIHFVLANGVYRISGGQPIPCGNKVDFVGLATSAGYANVYKFQTLESLGSNIEAAMNKAGPTLVCLTLLPLTEWPPLPLIKTVDIISRFRAALQHSASTKVL